MIVRVFALATWLLTGGVVAFLVWANGRGFDLTDGGLALLTMQYPGEVVVGISTAHWFTAVLYWAAGYSIAGARNLGLALTVASVLLLYLGIDRAVRQSSGVTADIWERRTAAALAVMAGLLGYTWFLPNPSYNWVTAWAVSAAMGCLLFGLTSPGPSSRVARLNWWMVACGLILTIAFFSKIPTALALSVVLGLVLVLWHRRSWRPMVVHGAAIAGGACVMAGIYFVCCQTPSAWWAMLDAGWTTASQLGAGIGDGMFVRYRRELETVVRGLDSHVWVVAGLLAVSGAALRATANRRSAWSALAAVAAGMLFSYAAYWHARQLMALAPTEYFLDVVRFYSGWLVMAGMFALGSRAGLLTRTRGLMLVLFLLPFAVSSGTGNAIFINMIFGLAPWFVIAAYCLQVPKGGWWGPACSGAVMFVLALLCAAHIVRGAYLAPYRINTGLAGQVSPTELGYPTSTLKLDPAASTFFAEFRAIARTHGFQPGDDLLAFFDLPGLVFAVGGRSPGLPNYPGAYPGSRAMAEAALRLVGPVRAGRSFLVETPRSAEWLKELGPLGIDFPNAYVFGGEVPVPYPWPGGVVRLWRPKSRGDSGRN